MFKLKLIQLSYKVSNIFLNLFRKILWAGKRPLKPHTVCIYRIGNIGDVICSLPAMHAIGQTYPDAKLILLTSPGERGMPGAYDFLKDAFWLDKIIVYYADQIKSYKQKLQFIQKLRGEKIDILFELPNNLISFRIALRNMILFRLTGVKWAYGWRISTIYRCASLQSEHLNFTNEVDRLLTILSETGVTANKPQFQLPVNKQDRHFAKDIIAGNNLNIALAPGAKRSTNRWPPDRFAEVAMHLISLGGNVLLIGGSGDKSVCDEINRRCGNKCKNIAGTSSILESAALLEKCQLTIACDSGVQHIAAAMGIACITLFSAWQLYGKWFPYGKNHTVIRKWPDCHTCFLDNCPKDNLCMRMISAEEVIEVIDEKIKSV